MSPNRLSASFTTGRASSRGGHGVGAAGCQAGGGTSFLYSCLAPPRPHLLCPSLTLLSLNPHSASRVPTLAALGPVLGMQHPGHSWTVLFQRRNDLPEVTQDRGGCRWGQV